MAMFRTVFYYRFIGGPWDKTNLPIPKEIDVLEYADATGRICTYTKINNEFCAFETGIKSS